MDVAQLLVDGRMVLIIGLLVTCDLQLVWGHEGGDPPFITLDLKCQELKFLDQNMSGQS